MFYCPSILTTPCLSEEESAHAVQVLRAVVGTELDVTDGCGHIYRCRVTNPHRKHCELEIVSTRTPAPLHQGYVHIALAPTKNMDRTEWFLEKATEMGVDEITLLLCRHSERRTVNIERLQRIVVAAAKQSLRATFPRLNDLTSFSDVLTDTSCQDHFIAHCEDGYAASSSKHSLRDCLTVGHSSLVLIGPEGDFSPEEIQSALSSGFRPVSLGNGRLRTETAALVACHTLILPNE